MKHAVLTAYTPCNKCTIPLHLLQLQQYANTAINTFTRFATPLRIRCMLHLLCTLHMLQKLHELHLLQRIDLRPSCSRTTSTVALSASSVLCVHADHTSYIYRIHIVSTLPPVILVVCAMYHLISQ